MSLNYVRAGDGPPLVLDPRARRQPGQLGAGDGAARGGARRDRGRHAGLRRVGPPAGRDSPHAGGDGRGDRRRISTRSGSSARIWRATHWARGWRSRWRPTANAASVCAISPAGLWRRPLGPRSYDARARGKRLRPFDPRGASHASAGGERSCARPSPSPRSSAGTRPCGWVSAWLDAPSYEDANDMMRTLTFERAAEVDVPVTIAWGERGPPGRPATAGADAGRHALPHVARAGATRRRATTPRAWPGSCSRRAPTSERSRWRLGPPNDSATLPLSAGSLGQGQEEVLQVRAALQALPGRDEEARAPRPRDTRRRSATTSSRSTRRRRTGKPPASGSRRAIGSGSATTRRTDPMQMRAAVLEEFGEPLVIQERDAGRPGAR